MRCIVSQLNDPSSEHKSPNPQSYRGKEPHDHSNRLRWDDPQRGPIRGTPQKKTKGLFCNIIYIYIYILYIYIYCVYIYIYVVLKRIESI